MRVGIICYASVGGSGVVATELAHALGDRGHEVHLVSADLPFRWRWASPRVTFERVETPSYPVFHEPQYLLALTNTLVRVSRRHRLEILHAHYAVPHATAAYLAHQILASEGAAPRTVTTLHGTDITLVANDPSYAGVVAFSIGASHAITAVSESLRRDTLAATSLQRDIRVIPNFLDIDAYSRQPDPALRARLCPPGACDGLVVHVSNFRPVKRVGEVLEVFRRIRARVSARLVMIGDGPDRPAAERQAAAMGLTDLVDFVGDQYELVPWLSAADLFLLPSSQESFGLAALEAMSCGAAVIASNVGGLPELITDGVTGFVRAPDDVDGMAQVGVALLEDPERRLAIARAAVADVRERFSVDRIVPAYEQLYDDALAGRT